MGDEAIYCVGLSGDGDEIAAIDDVEREFGVTLDYRDASGWVTAGDVFRSLQKALAAGSSEVADPWPRFAERLAGQTGIDPALIQASSPLLLPQPSFWVRVSHASALILIVAAFALVCGVIASAF